MSVKQRMTAAWLTAALVALPLGGVAMAAPPADNAPVQVAFLGHHSSVTGRKHHRLRNAALLVGGAAVGHHMLKKHREKKALRQSQSTMPAGSQ